MDDDVAEEIRSMMIESRAAEITSGTVGSALGVGGSEGRGSTTTVMNADEEGVDVGVVDGVGEVGMMIDWEDEGVSSGVVCSAMRVAEGGETICGNGAMASQPLT